MATLQTPATKAAQRALTSTSTCTSTATIPPPRPTAWRRPTALGLDPGARVQDPGSSTATASSRRCVVPAAAELDLRALGKRAALRPTQRAERVTGYVAGGISPLGQRRALPTLVDDTALDHATVFVSAGRRGLEIELAPADLVAVTSAEVASFSKGRS